IRDNKKVSVMLHTIGNLERMSDHARNIAESVEKMNEKQLTFSEKGREELRVYCAALTENIDLTMKALKDEDIETARMVEPLEEVIDNLNERAKRHHVKRLQKGKCTMELGVMLEDLMTDLERISDHCSNIAVTIIEIADDTYDTHEYLDTLKESQTPEFQRLYAQFDQKYHI
ncbi:MAG: Na/Pi cotransporter family protein, partial [Lachnospiraceae bacterium]|nr:Na/Pi cotransporter family protein [Lachnospiraceae bacterium]